MVVVVTNLNNLGEHRRSISVDRVGFRRCSRTTNRRRMDSQHTCRRKLFRDGHGCILDDLCVIYEDVDPAWSLCPRLIMLIALSPESEVQESRSHLGEGRTCAAP